MTEPANAAIYTRVSTQEQSDGWSLRQQYDACREYAAEQGFDVVRAFEDVHSGQDYDRPAFSRLLRLARQGAFGRILVWRMDRFGRDPAWNLLLERDLRDRDVAIETVTNGPLGTTPEARLYRIVQYGVDLYEAEKTAEECQEGRERAAEEGSWPGGRPPAGYTLNKQDHSLEIDPDEAPRIREIYRLACEDHTLREIEQATSMRSDTVRRRLRNPAYKGTLAYGEVETPNAWEPIVSPDTWARANAGLDERQPG